MKTIEPKVKLITSESSKNPFATTIAAAWSCYSSKPSTIEDVLNAVENREKQKRTAKLYRDLFNAGHHTTFQHSNFVFIIDGVSRLAVWSFFHSHPFYNSEQVSQRYREVGGKYIVVPPLQNSALKIYENAIEKAINSYKILIELLQKSLEEEYFKIYPSRKDKAGDWEERKIILLKKKSQEVARYVLPLATPCHLYHTINALTLLRYYRLCNQFDAPWEVRKIVQLMIEEVLKVDRNFLGRDEFSLKCQPLPVENTLEYELLQSLSKSIENKNTDEKFFEEFDRSLDGKSSKLISYSPSDEKIICEMFDSILGTHNKFCIDDLMNPQRNGYLGDHLNLSMNSKIMQVMNQVYFTFKKKISGAEFAQNQRHRGTPSTHPVLISHLREKSDCCVPYFIKKNQHTLDVYNDCINKLWNAKNKLLDIGVKKEYVLYLLPNSHNIRFYESGSLASYYWKWQKRLCFNAQREIFESAVEEVEQVKKIFQTVGKYIDCPPCVFRYNAKKSPSCPEGEHYCGISVWKNYKFQTITERRAF